MTAPAQGGRTQRPVALAMSLTLSLALLGLLLWRVDLRALAAQLTNTHWGWAGASAFFVVAGVWARARRWRYLFPPGSNPPALFRASMIGYMANNVLPLRAGEIVRGYVVARRWSSGLGVPLATLVVERVLDGLAVLLILGGLLLVVQMPAGLRWVAAAFLVADLAALAVIVAIAIAPGFCRRLISHGAGRWAVLERRLLHWFEVFVEGLVGIRTVRHAGPILWWSFLVWLTAALATWSALFAARLRVPLAAAWAVLAFVGLGASLPSAPGYVGVFHSAAVLALAMFRVSRSVALSYAILYHACGFVPVTLFGWLLLLREHLTLGELRRSPKSQSQTVTATATWHDGAQPGIELASPGLCRPSQGPEIRGVSVAGVVLAPSADDRLEGETRAPWTIPCSRAVDGSSGRSSYG